MSANTITIASFDIGKRNFAYLVEEFSVDSLDELKSFPITKKPLKHKYNKDGTPVKAMTSVLEKVCQNGVVIGYDNIDLVEEVNIDIDQSTFVKLTEILDDRLDLWDVCSVILIEKQMSFGKAKTNPMALRLAHHCYSYFVIKYGMFKTIISYPAYNKTKVLGATKGLTPHFRKKWSGEKALAILGGREQDSELFFSLMKTHKKDDIADCFLQLQALKYTLFVEGRI